jgi:hypothetical protein
MDKVLLDGISQSARSRIRANWRAFLPPKDSKRRVSRENLVALLVLYRSWKHLWPGQSKYRCRAQFLTYMAGGSGLHYRSPYANGVWRTSGAIDKQLKLAEMLEKDDADFTREVCHWWNIVVEKHFQTRESII